MDWHVNATFANLPYVDGAGVDAVYGRIKEQAVKPLEEAGELMVAVVEYAKAFRTDACVGEFDDLRERALDELADTYQALSNLAEVLGVTPYERDLAAHRCDGRNRARGRF